VLQLASGTIHCTALYYYCCQSFRTVIHMPYLYCEYVFLLSNYSFYYYCYLRLLLLFLSASLLSAKRSAVTACVLNFSPEPRKGVGIPVAYSYDDPIVLQPQPTGPGPGRCPPTIGNAADVYRLFMEASEQRPDVVILRSCYRPDQRGGGASFEWLDGVVRALHCSGTCHTTPHHTIPYLTQRCI